MLKLTFTISLRRIRTLHKTKSIDIMSTLSERKLVTNILLLLLFRQCHSFHNAYTQKRNTIKYFSQFFLLLMVFSYHAVPLSKLKCIYKFYRSLILVKNAKDIQTHQYSDQSLILAKDFLKRVTNFNISTATFPPFMYREE